MLTPETITQANAEAMAARHLEHAVHLRRNASLMDATTRGAEVYLDSGFGSGFEKTTYPSALSQADVANEILLDEFTGVVVEPGSQLAIHVGALLTCSLVFAHSPDWRGYFHVMDSEQVGIINSVEILESMGAPLEDIHVIGMPSLNKRRATDERFIPMHASDYEELGLPAANVLLFAQDALTQEIMEEDEVDRAAVLVRIGVAGAMTALATFNAAPPQYLVSQSAA